MIAEGGLDGVEGNTTNEWVYMIEETNVSFEGDDDNAGSEGSLSVDNPVYPNQRNFLADEDEKIAQKMKDLMKYIDLQQPDPFDPSNCCKVRMIPPSEWCTPCWFKSHQQPPLRGRGGDGIVEGSPDDSEGGINDEWVCVIEETNAVFEVDDNNAGSEGSVSVDNPVYPNQGNLSPDDDDQIA